MRPVMLAAIYLLAAVAAVGAQSLTYSRGQNVSPAFEGWEQEPDGSKYFVFGYMNRNWEEEVDVPVGPDNSFSVGPADQGQPTHFLPRRNRFVFRVSVPPGFTETSELVWSLTTKGKAEKAYASLRLDYSIDGVVRASETGALGAGSSSPEVRSNKAPFVEMQGKKLVEAKVGAPVMLTAVVSDDGIPRPRAIGAGAAVSNTGSSRDLTPANSVQLEALRARRMYLPPSRITVGKIVGLHATWYVYRGSGRVTFDPPDQIAAWEDTRTSGNSPWAPLWTPPEMPAGGKVTVRATFHEPGVYVLRAHADDGALTTHGQVTVTVTK